MEQYSRENVVQVSENNVTLEEALLAVKELKLQKNRLITELMETAKELEETRKENAELKARVVDFETGKETGSHIVTQLTADAVRWSELTTFVKELHGNGRLIVTKGGDYCVLRGDVSTHATKETLDFWGSLGFLRRDAKQGLLIGRRIGGILTRVYIFNPAAISLILGR